MRQGAVAKLGGRRDRNDALPYWAAVEQRNARSGDEC